MNQSIFERLCRCVRSVRTVDASMGPGSFFMEDLRFESIDIVDLIFFLEEEFEVNLTMRELHDHILSLKLGRWDFTLEQLTDLIEKKVSK